MLVLIPPSEGKTAPASGRSVDLDRLTFPELTDSRARVLAALLDLCDDDADRAREVLGLGPRQADDVRRNADLLTQPTGPARSVYTGVLFDAWDPGSMTTADRRRADRRVAIASALFGLLRPSDRIPAYRLSADVTLPGVGRLAGVWREALPDAIRAAAGRGVVLDLRSSAYVALGPVPADLAERTAVARVLQERNGRRSVVSHHNKATKGRLVRSLIEGPDCRDVTDLAGALGESGHRVELEPPAREGQPWRIDVVVTDP